MFCWPPALLCFAASRPALLYWPSALLCFTGHKICSALLVTSPGSALLATSLALLIWPPVLLCLTGHQPCYLLACLAQAPPPPPPPPPHLFCLPLFCLGLTLSLPIESHPGRHHRWKKGLARMPLVNKTNPPIGAHPALVHISPLVLSAHWLASPPAS